MLDQNDFNEIFDHYDKVGYIMSFKRDCPHDLRGERNYDTESYLNLRNRLFNGI